ncbi:hypothetical protein EV702DRAFT_1202766 [Suillus placidus]|uniref:Uncharacterized protein n=1 Tax=Suillus placidus TaxID=48579 RepID=A0A9P6ZK80_9AGAM|nr:hypothetical protein EV702DRAFT_1202766 [Suillus placidus]
MSDCSALARRFLFGDSRTGIGDAVLLRLRAFVAGGSRAEDATKGPNAASAVSQAASAGPNAASAVSKAASAGPKAASAVSKAASAGPRAASAVSKAASAVLTLLLQSPTLHLQEAKDAKKQKATADSFDDAVNSPGKPQPYPRPFSLLPQEAAGITLYDGGCVLPQPFGGFPRWDLQPSPRRWGLPSLDGTIAEVCDEPKTHNVIGTSVMSEHHPPPNEYQHAQPRPTPNFLPKSFPILNGIDGFTGLDPSPPMETGLLARGDLWSDPGRCLSLGDFFALVKCA